MATLNVGAIACRLGLDPSEFLDKMKGVQGFNGFASAEMTRQWKQTSREGTESFRLIDEALGIHISKPLTRILTQEFPAFASALQSLLGAGVVGALGMAAFEVFEHIAKSVEHAQKAEEELQTSTRKSGEVFTNALQSYEKAAKLRSLSGMDKKIFEIDASSTEEGRKKIDELAASLQKVATTAADAHKWTTELLAGVGDAAHVIFNSQSTLGMEETAKQFVEFQRRFDQISQLDLLHGTHESAKYVAEQIAAAEKSLMAMTAMKLTPMQSFEGEVNKFVPQLGLGPQVGFTADEITAQKTFLDNLKKIAEVLGASAKDQTGRENEARKAESAERQLKAQEAIGALFKDMRTSIGKLQPETDPIAKIYAEVTEFRAKAEADFVALRKSSDDALQLRAAHTALGAYGKELDAIKLKLESDVLAKQALDQLSKPGALGAPIISKQPPVSLATPAMMPTLSAGGLAGAQFDTFAKDQVAQLKMAEQAYQDAMGPQQKFKLTEQELDLLLKEKLIDQNAYNAALAQAISLKTRSAKQGLGGAVDELNPGGGKMQELQQRMQALQAMVAKGQGLDGAKLNAGELAAVKLEMQAIEEEEDKILMKTGGIDTGIKAWADDLQRVQSEGEFVYAMLTQATKGFEDNAAKSLIQILEAQRGGHAKLIQQLRTEWSNFFNSLAEMALKHSIEKLLAPVGAKILQQFPDLGKMFGQGNQPKAPALPPTAPGSMTGLGALAKAPATAANTTALTANTAAHTANTTAFTTGTTALSTGLTANTTALGLTTGALTALSASLAGDSATGAASSIAESAGHEAGGTDDWSGGPTWVGEQGPEILNLPRGSQITPNNVATKGGGDIHQYFDQRGAVVTDDLMRKGESARAMANTKRESISESLSAIADMNRRTLRSQ
jgi:hypothetical protein